MKYFAYLMSALILFAAAEANAKGNNNKHNNAAQLKAAKAAQEKREKERKERDEKNKKIKSFLDGCDANHDGSVSRDEFVAGESNKEKALEKFKDANKNGDSSLTKSEIADMLGLK
jgi:hypothetical protein